MNKNTKLALFTYLIMFSVSVCALEISNNIELKRITVEQKILTQKVLKDYCMIGLHINLRNPKDDLSNVIKMFNHNNILLQKSMDKAEMLDSLNKTVNSWQKLQNTLGMPIDKKHVKTLFLQLDDMDKHLDITEKMIAATINDPNNEIIDLSANQKVLSQKIVGLYMLNGWSIPELNVKKELQDTVDAFSNNHSKIEALSVKSETLNVIIKKVNKSFMFVKMQVSGDMIKFTPSLIYKKTNDILRLMDEVVTIQDKKDKGV